MSIAEKLTTIAENEQKVFDAGKQAEYDKFWDIYQTNGKRQYYQYAFYGNGWYDDIYNPKYTIKPVNGNSMFQNTQITDTKVVIDCTSMVVGTTYLFNSSPTIKTIRKIIVYEDLTYTGWFSGCTGLENIVIEGIIGNTINFQVAKNLTAESIRSIVNCLSSTATGQTLTLSQTAVNNAFTTEEWNELIADKRNWTISLV